MPLPIILRVMPQADGAWRIVVDNHRTRPGEGVLHRDQVAALLRRWERAEEVRFPAVPVPGQRGEVQCADAEERIGQTLSAVFRTLPALQARLAEHLGKAEGEREAAVVVVDVDASDPRVRGLPWELLASPTQDSGLEAGGAAVIARLTQGRPAARSQPATRFRFLRWSPTPGDPLCRARMEAIDAWFERVGLPCPVDVDPRQGMLPPSEPGHADVLHLICHGWGDLDRVHLVLNDGPHPPGEPAHLLSHRLPDLRLVVLDVCEAGGVVQSELANLAGRLVAAGAPLCVAPVRQASLEACQAFSQGLYSALVLGQPIPLAVAQGRRAVRGLARPYPDSRWCNHVLYVGDLDALTAPGLRPGWMPRGCPPPSPEAAELLDRAFRLARERDDGYVGLEHLLRAQGGLPVAVAVGTQAWILLGELEETWLVRPRGVVRQPGGGIDEGGTPRLQAVTSALPPGFGVEMLWQRIAADLDPGGATWSAVPPGRTLRLTWTLASGTLTPSGPTPFPGAAGDAPPDSLRVLGGPEDGRVLKPGPKEEIGRWDEESPTDHGLYRGTPLVDATLHRRHVEWLGPGDVRPLHTLSLGRGHQTLQVQPQNLKGGRLALQVGDVLVLTRATRLQALDIGRSSQGEDHSS